MSAQPLRFPYDPRIDGPAPQQAWNTAYIGGGTVGDDLAGLLIDWDAFWQRESEAQWLAEPIIAAKRAHAIFAPGGTGKSLLALWLAAALATGRALLDGKRRPPVHVLYLDYEMTEDDLDERLTSMGYGPEDDLSHLHYALLPSIAPLDTEAGGQLVRRLAASVDAEVVIVDTFGRAVQGDENDADTVRAFYRACGMGLKADGRAWVRVDHAGKDITKGQRGTSAKNDDVDVVWLVTRGDNGLKLLAMKRRMGWVPENVELVMSDDPTLRFGLARQPVLPVGTGNVMADLDDLEVPPTASVRVAAKALKDAGRGVRIQVVTVAQRLRRDGAFVVPNDPLRPVDNPGKRGGKRGLESDPEIAGKHDPGNAHLPAAETLRETLGNAETVEGGGGCLPIRETPRHDPAPTPDDDPDPFW